ncbi:PTS-dependent dihydroxyacetone kinase, ADP-binding subunit dhaL [Anaerobiospirillum thomasii]|uniref:PTS-dependent dihydroxyacetone kinase, ADP-binding subunit dhaL n=1 Tax=Anaerobiospirillum thomasii TaxID=179995 RepID=A0A2X0WPE3_9GAMM|nr:dihydroxyacetone kinase subunit DhaL [Anaerobiospirillum thomasii]SPT69070.1 PTS-dependent dihydroxyacetone kinase, ADP-binding subunit dhaL [Anaerobiospirillum thomasii]SPT72387.1 PTS-dependent dihydroxyacetone kinase, ADP-binding subunit dhaL [Anaerobiospirillum thomasii]
MSFTKENFIKAIEQCSALMEQNKQYLIDMDSAFGDGDLGLTMTAGFAAAFEFVSGSGETDMGKLAAQMGMAISKKVPSTMGTLVASGFIAAGKALKGKTALEADDLALFFKSFVEGVKSRGKADVGDRTIVDSIAPASEAFGAAIASGKDIKAALETACAAAADGVEATKNMQAKFGRAVYYGEQVLGKEDQGSVVGKLIFEGFFTAY